MDEVKFRYVFKHRKTGEFVVKIYDIYQIETYGIESTFSDMSNEYYHVNTRDQFTGYLDKNGKEIYCGDIVQRNNDNPISFNDGSKKYQTWFVNFEFAGWHFDNTPVSPCISYPSFYSNAQYMEVIGNIYENPELMEVPA